MTPVSVGNSISSSLGLIGRLENNPAERVSEEAVPCAAISSAVSGFLLALLGLAASNRPSAPTPNRVSTSLPTSSSLSCSSVSPHASSAHTSSVSDTASSSTNPSNSRLLSVANAPFVSVPPNRSSSSVSAVADDAGLASSSEELWLSRSAKSSCCDPMPSGFSRISSETKACPPSVLSSSSKSPSNKSAKLFSSSGPTSGPVTLTVAKSAFSDSSAFSSLSTLRLSIESSEGISLKSKSRLRRLSGSRSDDSSSPAVAADSSSVDAKLASSLAFLPSEP